MASSTLTRGRQREEQRQNVSVNVIDSVMGSGKTSYAIQMMQEAPRTRKFLYVTPFKNEVNRIIRSVPNREFVQPFTDEERLDEETGDTKTVRVHATKMESLRKLVEEERDIVTTHSLFSLADDDFIRLLHMADYTLVLDEVMNVVNTIATDMTKKSIQQLLNDGWITVDDDGKVNWVIGEQSRYDDIREYAMAGNLYLVYDKLFVWNFPARVFRAFDEVYILTYLFDGQIQKAYYDFHDIEYNKFGVVQLPDGRYEIASKTFGLSDDREQFRRLIHVYEGHLNDIGTRQRGMRNQPLSSTWFDVHKNKPEFQTLKRNLYNYLRNVRKAKADDIMWTSFKRVSACRFDPKKRHDEDGKVWHVGLAGKGFANAIDDETSPKGTASFIPFNARATNRYAHKTELAYCLNRFMLATEKMFFTYNGIEVDEDLLALSDLLQWLFRSAVRNGEEVWLYIPSERMRRLLYDWLDGKF